MIITLRTDRPEAEVGVFAADGTKLGYRVWHAHRELSVTLLTTIRDELAAHHSALQEVSGIVVFRGPGSFTGLRIGMTVANSFAYSLNVSIVGTGGDDWIAEGLRKLRGGQNDRLVLPEYGAEAHITPSKK